ncbi:ABC transporter permease [Tessaracoccus sp. MC1865]|nr:ABC transporter permease [Tessaracoccus sp. MC1865]
MKDWRRGRADRSLWQALSDGYVMVFSIVLIGAMVISSIVRAQQVVAICDTAGCLAARGLLPWASVAGILASTLVLSRMFGPVVASAAEGFWLMDGPTDRRRLLAGRLVAAIVLALVVGGLLGALIAALTGSPLPEVGIWALAGGFGSAGLLAFAAAEQGLDRRWVVTVLQWMIGAIAIGTLVLLVFGAAGWIDLGGAHLIAVELAYIVAGVGLLLVLVAGFVAYRRLRGVRRNRLTAGGSLLSGLQGAAFALEFALIRDILIEAKAREKGHVKPTRGAGSGMTALVMRDVQRLWRQPMRLVTLAATVVVPYAVQALGLATLNPPLSALVLVAALIPFMNSLRVLTRTRGLQRCFPFDPGKVKQAAMVVPGVLALLWAVATLPAFMGVGGGVTVEPVAAASAAVVTGIAGFLGAVRWVSARPPDYSGPIMSTGFGAMPPGLMFSLLRGLDMVALVTLPIVLGWPVWISLVVGLIAFMILRSGLDREQLMEQQEEQKRELAEERRRREGTAAPKAKIKVQRNR